MNHPRWPHDEDPTDEEGDLGRFVVADQYWAELQRNPCLELRRWLGERHIEDPALIDDLGVIARLHLLSQQSETNAAEQRDPPLSATRTLTRVFFESRLSLPKIPANESATNRARPERIGKYLVLNQA
jgi:hypothetical protein